MQLIKTSFRISRSSDKMSEWIKTFMNPVCHIYKAKQSDIKSSMWIPSWCWRLPREYLIGTRTSPYVAILFISMILYSSTPYPDISYLVREILFKTIIWIALRMKSSRSKKYILTWVQDSLHTCWKWTRITSYRCGLFWHWPWLRVQEGTCSRYWTVQLDRQGTC